MLEARYTIRYERKHMKECVSLCVWVCLYLNMFLQVVHLGCYQYPHLVWWLSLGPKCVCLSVCKYARALSEDVPSIRCMSGM